MGGLLGNSKVARKGPGQGYSQCDIGNVPVYQCRDYSRGYPRTVVSSLPCHMGPPPGGYHDPYHHHYPPAALPNTNQDLGYGEEAENWSESTLIYFGVGLVTIAILSKFIQDFLRSSSARAPRPPSPKKAVVYSPPEHREEWTQTGGEKESLLSMKHLFYGEPESVVILKTDDNTVRGNLHQYKYFGMHSEDSKGGPKPAEPLKQGVAESGSGKKKQKGEKDESKKEEQKKDEGKKEESEDKKDGKSEEEKKGGGKHEEKKGEAKSEGGKKKKGGGDAAKDGAKKEEAPPATRDILLRVPMCCTECELTAAEALREVKGVIDVQCDYHEEKVAVTVVGDVQAPDLLLKCRSLKLFRKSSYWK